MSNTDIQACPRASGSTGVLARLTLVAALGVALAACGGADEPTAAPSTPPAPAAATAAQGSDEAAAAAAQAEGTLAAMGADELRTAARAAYSENRLYAPAGDNAVEYFLALRGKSPGDASASSALTDLLPMTVIATEQSLAREDFEEGERLIALLGRVDASHPALERLRHSVETGKRDMANRLAREQVSAEEQARRQAELERQRAAEQQRQQEAAARELAEQQSAAEQEEAAAAARAAAAQREQEAAERLAAEQRAAEQRRAEAQRRPTAADLRPLSTPAPEYPRTALRTGQSGEVEVEITIGTDGAVSAARVIRADPARVFDRAALSAVERWRFQPLSEPVTARRTIAFSPD
ncbi:energy transducer TonB [Lysobacter sp. GX 14042]|uniref:energy transducer TonB n=1 Tax=Lysobacter sp. GX 14042 TaxID=2907155 RepID=UPI001F488E05|nr:energy transducer TonB [Lysobacter sp. GX 14042]MCE7032355.1 energy transducer TonB [Lysobacter sp. GX 14042]